MISKFELVMKIRGFDINSQYLNLLKIQKMSKSEFNDFKNLQKWDIAKFHYENNNFYKKKVGKFFPDNWEDLPVLKKSDFQNYPSTILTKGYNSKNTYFGSTSGSSGNPFFFAKNKESHAMDWALIKDRYLKRKINLNSFQARFFGVYKNNRVLIKDYIKNYIMNRKYFSIIDFENHINVFFKNKFKYIYGYTNSLVLFARFLIKENIILKDICPTITKCIVTSEILTIEDRMLLSKSFGIEVVNEYGASEVGILAFELDLDKLVLSNEILFFENIDSNHSKNKISEIIVTDYDNLAMPFIRYNIGDLGIISDEFSSKLNNNNILKQFSGRGNDLIILENRILPGFFIVKPFDYFFADHFCNNKDTIQEFLIKQKTKRKFILDLVINRELTSNEKEKMKSIIKNKLGQNIQLIINKKHKIHRLKSGKLKQFISELN